MYLASLYVKSRTPIGKLDEQYAWTYMVHSSALSLVLIIYFHQLKNIYIYMLAKAYDNNRFIIVLVCKDKKRTSQ